MAEQNTQGQKSPRQAVAKLLGDLKRKALVVCTGSEIGFSHWLLGLQRLQKEEGFRFDLYLSESATQVLDLRALKETVHFDQVWPGCNDQPPEVVAAPYPTIIVPAMTINTAAKIAGCMADTPAARVIFTSLLQGKNVIVAVDGCCPDHEARQAKGCRIAEPLKAQLRSNIKRMGDYGAVITTAKAVAQKTLEVVDGGSSSPKAVTEPGAAASEIQERQGRVVDCDDVAALPAGSGLQVSRNHQITRQAAEAARNSGVLLMKE